MLKGIIAIQNLEKAMRGAERPGHKYLRRKPKGKGYEYVYKEKSSKRGTSFQVGDSVMVKTDEGILPGKIKTVRDRNATVTLDEAGLGDWTAPYSDIKKKEGTKGEVLSDEELDETEYEQEVREVSKHFERRLSSQPRGVQKIVQGLPMSLYGLGKMSKFRKRMVAAGESGFSAYHLPQLGFEWDKRRLDHTVKIGLMETKQSSSGVTRYSLTKDGKKALGYIKKHWRDYKMWLESEDL